MDKPDKPFRLRKGDIILIVCAVFIAGIAAIAFSARGGGGSSFGGAGGGFGILGGESGGGGGTGSSGGGEAVGDIEISGGAMIMVDGKLWREAPLQTDARIIYDDGDRYNVILVEDGGVRMEEANCPDGLCVKQGIITNGNSVIVCLPNRVSIRISNMDGSKIEVSQ